MTDTVEACPECNKSGSVHRRVDPVDKPAHYCGQCGADFEQPAERERQTPKRKSDTLPTAISADMKAQLKAMRDSGQCQECGAELASGYLCDECDTVDGWSDE